MRAFRGLAATAPLKYQGHVILLRSSIPCRAGSCAAPAADAAAHQLPLALRQWLRPQSPMAEDICALSTANCVVVNTSEPIVNQAASCQHAHITYKRCARIPLRNAYVPSSTLRDPLVAMLARLGRHDLEWPPADREVTLVAAVMEWWSSADARSMYHLHSAHHVTGMHDKAWRPFSARCAPGRAGR
jgi:hypothetical protein